MKNTFKNILTAVAAIALSIPAFAQEQPKEQDWSAIRTNKTATYDAANDKVDITLETFVNGYKSNIWTPKIDEKQVPLDIVLVLDVSGSMDEKMDSRPSYYKTSDNAETVLANLKSGKYYWKRWGGYDKINSVTRGILTGRQLVNGNILYEFNIENVYEYQEVSQQTKIEALKVACKSFIEKVAEESADGSHQISIVKFASDENTTTGNEKNNNNYNYTQIVKELTDADKTNELKEAIDNLSEGGATSADYGLNRAEAALKSARSDSKKLVVMFTDGDPNHSNGFNTTVANNAITKAKTLKTNGVTIYTVGVFTDPSDNTEKYMNYVSSNYPEADSMTKPNNQAKDEEGNVISKYSLTASDADELNNIFETIAGEEAHNTGTGSNKGAGVNLGGEDTSVTLKDIVTTNFVIPQTNGVPTDITLKLIPAVSVSVNEEIAHRNDSTHAPAYNSYVIGWETDPSKWETITPSEGQVTVDGNTLNVDGKVFDFSANWIGVEEKWTKQSPKDIIDPSATKQILGKKLVISFSVKPDPTKAGGKVETNTKDSGVYVEGENVTPGNKAEYDVPKPVFVPANITIRKSGMLPGESAIFEVTATGTGYSKTYTVAMTANEAGEMKDAVIMRVPIVTNPNAEAAGEALDYITYTVKETTWSWAYDSAAQACQETANETVTANSITRVMTNSEKTHLFEFKNTPKSETPKHGESNANNIFAK